MKPASRSISWACPTILSDISYEFSLVEEPDPSPPFEPNSAFSWLAERHLQSRVYTALDRLAPFSPIYGFGQEPMAWHSPPPSGAGNRVGLVVVEDNDGSIRQYGSNFVHREPRSSGHALPANLIERFRTATHHAQVNDAILLALDAVADDGWRRSIYQVECEGERFRTMPIYLAVVSREGGFFYCTSAHAHGPRQSRFALEFAGEVR